MTTNTATNLTLTEMERTMFDKGYVSCRMIAKKLHRHPTTVHRMLEGQKVNFVNMGPTKFVKVEDVLQAVDPDVAALFELNDWSDVVNDH